MQNLRALVDIFAFTEVFRFDGFIVFEFLVFAFMAHKLEAMAVEFVFALFAGQVAYCG